MKYVAVFIPRSAEFHAFAANAHHLKLICPSDDRRNLITFYILCDASYLGMTNDSDWLKCPCEFLASASQKLLVNYWKLKARCKNIK